VAEAARRRFQLVQREIPPNLEDAAERLLAFETSSARISQLNRGLDVEAVVAVQVSSALGWSAPLDVEARLFGGRTEPSAFERQSRVALSAGFTHWNPRALLAWGALALLAALRLVRGTGQLVVKVERGAAAGANVAITAYVGRHPLRGELSGRSVLRSSPVSGPQVVFDGLPAGTCYVAVRRVERDPKTLQVVGNHVQERSAEVRKGASVSVAFDCASEVAKVTVELHHGKQGKVAGQALLAVLGRPDSSRFVREGSTELALAAGVHTLLVGFADRAFRVQLKVPEKTRELSVQVDVDAAAKAFFAGCAAAVAPFVHGDLAGASQALAAAGLGGPAALLRAELHRAKGETREASEALEAAGRLREAARLRSAAGDKEGTARLLERAGDWQEAAREHEQAGRFEEAARGYARARRFDAAIACASRTGDRTLVAEVLEQKGDRLEAARICLEIDDVERATSLLQKLPLADPQYGEACLLLSQLFLQRGEPELALQKLDEAVDVFGSETSLELREQIARQLEARGDLRRALESYEHIRKRDIRYPGMAEKIEALRRKLQAPEPAAAPAASAAEAETQAAARYEVLDEIGRGGMGVVYRARDRMLGRVVALKRLPDNLKNHPTAVKLFLREARAVAALNHPSIVTLFDAGQEGDAYYLTMEYLEGRPLNELLKQRRRLSVRDAVTIGVQVADGLGYAHSEGVIHRDIKPSNLFLTTKSRVKIMDFGLAKMVEEVRKESSIIAGTPYYMAPEQAAGGAVDARADLYAFGVSLFELLTGEVPFREGDVTYHHRHTPPPDPRERGTAIPDPLAELVLALLAKRPEDRPETAAQVRDLLRRSVC
jgi:tetratricopeptide (TPR) repeat protein